MINYSIIIPHKNSVELLTRCLKSIPERIDIQIIVVDDDSDDFKSVQHTVSEFTNINLISCRDKLGAGHARNVGLDAATGKWILFADADDFFHNGAFEVLDNYLYSDSDIVFFNTDSCYSHDLSIAQNRFPKWPIYIAERNIEALKWDIPVVWGKLFSSELIKNNKLQFEEVFASNDIHFAYNANYLSKKIEIDDFCLYCSTKNQKSLCYNLNITNLDCRLGVTVRCNKFLREIGRYKYQTNLFAQILLYKSFGIKIFMSKLLYYFKVSTLSSLLVDVYKTISKIIEKIFKKGESSMKFQKIENDSFYKK